MFKQQVSTRYHNQKDFVLSPGQILIVIESIALKKGKPDYRILPAKKYNLGKEVIYHLGITSFQLKSRLRFVLELGCRIADIDDADSGFDYVCENITEIQKRNNFPIIHAKRI